MVAGTDKSHWLTSTSQPDDGAVRDPGVRRGAKHPVVVVAGALLLVLLVWQLFRAPTAEIDGLAGGLGAAASPSTTSPPADPTTTTQASSSTATDPDSDVVDVAELDPALTRFFLFGQQSGRVLRVDLADGTVSDHSAGGRLIGEFAGQLYFVTTNAGVEALHLDDLDAEPATVRPPGEPGKDVFAATLTADGILHLTIGSFSAAEPDITMIRLDVLTGAEQVAEVDQFGSFGLIEVAGAGLFELSSNGFRPLVDGSVRFYGERVIGVEECGAPLSCRRYWLDRQTRVELERREPEQSSGWLLGPSGRIAVTFEIGGRRFVDTETGEALPELAGAGEDRGFFAFGVPDDITPDERFLAVAGPTGADDVSIHDLLNDVSWTLELPRTFNLSKVLFVPKAEVAS